MPYGGHGGVPAGRWTDYCMDMRFGAGAPEVTDVFDK
jgi:hypothetical protein